MQVDAGVNTECAPVAENSGTAESAGTHNPGVKFICLGGYLEYGRNCTVLRYKDYGLMLDCGINVGELQRDKPRYKEMVPKFNAVALRGIKYLGVLISHAHLDHIGAIPYFLKHHDVTIFGSPYTVEVCKNMGYPGQYEAIHPGGTIDLGVFSIKAISIPHSVPQSLFYRITIDQGLTVCYASDFKVDHLPVLDAPTDLAMLRKELRGTDIMVFDTTRAKTVLFTKSETYVKALANQHIMNSKLDDRHVIYPCFASNVGRLKSLIELAMAHGYAPYVVGKSFKYHLDAARTTGVYTPPTQANVRMINRNYVKFFSQPFAKRSLFVVSGGNGQSNAVLARLVRNVIPTPEEFLQTAVTLLGGSEIPATKWPRRKLCTQMALRGMEVHDQIHCSGHGSITDILRVVAAINPRILVPTHSSHETIGYFCDYLAEKELPYKLGRTVFAFQNGQVHVFHKSRPQEKSKSQDG